MKTGTKPVVVACPICSSPVSWIAQNRWKPFCSERCKLIDLGQWAAEAYRVPVVEQDPEDDIQTPQ